MTGGLSGTPGPAATEPPPLELPRPDSWPADPSLEAIEVDLLIEAVRRRYGIELQPGPGLADAARGLAGLCGGITCTGLVDRILHDPALADVALRTLREARDSLFDDAAFYSAFVRRVIPWLRTWPYASIWVAQCGDGASVLSMAILLEEAGLYDRCRIYATDDDPRRLQPAAAQPVSEAWLAASDANHRRLGGATTIAAHFVERGGRWRARPAIDRNVVRALYDVDGGRSFHEFNLIVCRTRLRGRAGALVPEVFDASLSPLGLLALAPSSALAIVGDGRYREWDRAAGMLQRVA